MSQLQLSSSKVLVKRKGDTITIVVMTGQYILIPTLTVIALTWSAYPHDTSPRQLSDSLPKTISTKDRYLSTSLVNTTKCWDGDVSPRGCGGCVDVLLYPLSQLKPRRLGTLLKNGVGLEEEFLSTIIYEIFWVSMFISFRGCIVWSPFQQDRGEWLTLHLPNKAL